MSSGRHDDAKNSADPTYVTGKEGAEALRVANRRAATTDTTAAATTTARENARNAGRKLSTERPVLYLNRDESEKRG